jgi:hypothetical protein
LRIPALADKAHEGAGAIFRTPSERHFGRELTAHQKPSAVHTPRLSSPVERAFAR